jgi:N-formylglutamate amidohydrolase
MITTENFVSHSADDPEGADLSPLLVIATHGGYDVVDGAPKRTKGVLDGDQFTKECAIAIADTCGAYLVICEAQRLYVDCNRGVLSEKVLNAEIAPAQAYMSETLPVEPTADGEMANPAASVYELFHATITERIARLAKASKMALLLDVHGNSFKSLKGVVYVTGCSMQATAGRPVRAELCSFMQAEGLQTNCDERETGDGVFTGGFVTHHYGREVPNCCALQLEIHVDFRKSADEARDCGRRIGRAVANYLVSFSAPHE